MFKDAKLNVRANGRDVDEYEGSVEGTLQKSLLHRDDKSTQKRSHMTKCLIEGSGR
jgi:hypothetical protein